MSERDRYPAGVPCWVETLQPDVQAALDFYGSLFGWEFAGPGSMPGDRPGQYFVARVRGRDVAGIGSLPHRRDLPRPIWMTHIRVTDADEAAERVKIAGGSLRDGPRDALPAGRLAVVADPAGALLCVWEAIAREGAQLVNESGAWALSSLRTADPAGSKVFYGSVFGWQPETMGAQGSDVTLWRLPGYVGGVPDQTAPLDTVGIMAPIPNYGPPGAHWSVDFWVDDVHATADHAADLGGRVIVPSYEAPGFSRAVLADPQGAVFTVTRQIASPDPQRPEGSRQPLGRRQRL
jgi:predicted enzyme related to lactoylglutathione lyase